MGVLDQIIGGVREDLAERVARVSRAELERLVGDVPPALEVVSSLRGGPISVISEVKRSSPSKGHLATIDDPADLAARYQEGGAAAISVLTEQRRFGGSLDDLRAVRAAVTIPVLRKDFIVTEYQLVEARAYGADLALLIVAALSDAELSRLHSLALDLGLTPLVEVHTEDETRRAADLGAQLVGVNNRNLQTLDVDPGMFERLVPLLPSDVVKVAESGLTGPTDVAAAHAHGADAVLIGEALVKDGDPAAAIRAMIDATR